MIMGTRSCRISKDDDMPGRPRPSGPEQEVPAPDEEVPAEPQPEREQRPPPERVAHDGAESGAERRHAADMAQGQGLPREQGAKQQRPDDISDYRMLCHTDLLGDRDWIWFITMGGPSPRSDQHRSGWTGP